MTRRSLKAKDVLLVGRLIILDPDLKSRPPHLGLKVWCPYCKGEHLHSWFDPPFRSDVVDHRVPHCERDHRPGGYHIGLDPSHEFHNRNVVEVFKLSLARWEARRSRTLSPDLARPEEPSHG